MNRPTWTFEQALVIYKDLQDLNRLGHWRNKEVPQWVREYQASFRRPGDEDPDYLYDFPVYAVVRAAWEQLATVFYNALPESCRGKSNH